MASVTDLKLCLRMKTGMESRNRSGEELLIQIQIIII